MSRDVMIDIKSYLIFSIKSLIEVNNIIKTKDEEIAHYKPENNDTLNKLDYLSDITGRSDAKYFMLENGENFRDALSIYEQNGLVFSLYFPYFSYEDDKFKYLRIFNDKEIDGSDVIKIEFETKVCSIPISIPMETRLMQIKKDYGL